jgi:sugar lactone lactonase YvrE
MDSNASLDLSECLPIGPLSLWERARVRAASVKVLIAAISLLMPSPPSPLPKGEGRFSLSAVLLIVLTAVLCVPALAEDPLRYPLSIAVSKSGTVFLADRELPGVWRLEGDRLSIFFKGSKKFRTPLNAIRCVTVDRDGRVVAGDSATSDVYRFDEKGNPRALTAQGKPYGQIGIPMAVAVDADGNLLVSDLETHRIVKIPKGGGQSQTLASVPAPRGLCIDMQNRLWVISGRKLVRIAPGGEQETIVGDGVFLFPHTVAVGENGTAYVCDGYSKAIWKVATGQKPEKWVSGSPLDKPVGIHLQQGRLFVVDPRAKGVFEIDPSGKLTRRKMQ